MRYTPYLDRIGVTFKPDVPDHAVNIIDAALSTIDQWIDWGSYQGRKRKPCPENPILLAGQPIGQYHCPSCGMMVLAAMPHLSPAKRESRCTCPAGSYDPGAVHTDDCQMNYPDDEYEDEYGRPWPPGYQDADTPAE